jgi:hypothetical protein
MVSQEDIIKTLLFLDIFDYPPTAMEIWRFLPAPAESGETIEKLSSQEGFQQKNGFYFLPGREELIEKRREFDYLAEKKFKIAKRAAWLLHFIPGIKMVAVCNNFYYRPQSDIDFFIIIKQGRMWLSRALATAVLHLFRLRRYGKKIADRICLSFYITEDNFNLEKIALRSADAADIDDPYLAYWLAFLKPIYGQGCYNEFWRANLWLKNYFPNILPIIAERTKVVEDNWLSGFKKKANSWWFDSFVGDYLEALTKKLQRKKMSARRSGPGVVIADNILKFHENDRREEFRNQLQIKNYKLKI